MNFKHINIKDPEKLSTNQLISILILISPHSLMYVIHIFRSTAQTLHFTSII